MKDNASLASKQPWYSGISSYEWIVLIIASAGWVFNVYEGQIFNLTRNDLLRELLGADSGHPDLKTHGDRLLGIFLLGGMFGGILFGSMADKYGRRPILILTILMYSIFSGLTYFAASVEQVYVLRFLVAMGIGGEWAVAAALVAEVFPTRARGHASGIFHTTSVLGTWLAALAAIAVGSNWRYAYLLGVLPVFLVVWVRISIKEPEKWERTKAAPEKKRGSVLELFALNPWRKHAILAVCLAAVGLGTFWALVIAGQDLMRETLQREQAVLVAGIGQDDPEALAETLAAAKLDDASIERRSKFAYGFIQTLGGGLGLLLFGPFSARIGRRGAFIVYHLAAALIVPVACFVPQSSTQLLLILPVFGFFTLGMHAGYAVYFPELFPNHLRATGSSVGFNGGRTLAFALLWYVAPWLKNSMPLHHALAWLGSLFLLGVVLVVFLPETKDQELPE